MHADNRMMKDRCKLGERPSPCPTNLRTSLLRPRATTAHRSSGRWTADVCLQGRSISSAEMAAAMARTHARGAMRVPNDCEELAARKTDGVAFGLLVAFPGAALFSAVLSSEASPLSWPAFSGAALFSASLSSAAFLAFSGAALFSAVLSSEAFFAVSGAALFSAVLSSEAFFAFSSFALSSEAFPASRPAFSGAAPFPAALSSAAFLASSRAALSSFALSSAAFLAS
mmetsp:Transcript_102394/g.315965  ORF Transcript_102394/g.315965 Transcript_102394/m.315965 type:complete len:228 (-) Transcript_102394:1118-1801(-)